MSLGVSVIALVGVLLFLGCWVASCAGGIVVGVEALLCRTVYVWLQ